MGKSRDREKHESSSSNRRHHTKSPARKGARSFSPAHSERRKKPNSDLNLILNKLQFMKERIQELERPHFESYDNNDHHESISVYAGNDLEDKESNGLSSEGDKPESAGNRPEISEGSRPINEEEKTEVDASGEKKSSEMQNPFFDPEVVGTSWQPSKELKAFLQKNFNRKLTSAQYKDLSESYSVPDVQECFPPKLEKDILKQIVSTTTRKATELADKDLAVAQRALLAATGPLCSLHDMLEEKKEISQEETLNILQKTLCLIGSASHSLTMLRRTKVLRAINPAKTGLAEKPFPNAGNSLFGPDLASIAAKDADVSKNLAKGFPNVNKRPYESYRNRQNIGESNRKFAGSSSRYSASNNRSFLPNKYHANRGRNYFRPKQYNHN